MNSATTATNSESLSYENCRLCPRSCGVNRRLRKGYCQSPAQAVAARAALHFWEEPCISGLHGSGTVFFSGCTLRCCFCQNYRISSEGFGKAVTAGRPRFSSFEENGRSVRLMERGVIIRHMVLPGQKEDSIRLLSWMKDSLPAGSFLISLLSQYTPFYHSSDYPEINRRITTYEYEKVVDAALSLGLTEGFMQKKSSAREEYTPSFALQGI